MWLHGKLEQGEIQISMSRRGNPYDNARAERFMRTLEEEAYGTEYRNLKDAQSDWRISREGLQPTKTAFRVTISNTGRVGAG
jgi:transposase InsO family protein